MRALVVVTTAVAALAAAGALAAAEFELPPGTWWQDERLAARVGLSADQQQQIERLVYDHALRMIDLNAAVKRAELELGNLVRRPDFDADQVRAAFTSFQAARQALERERFEMLLAVRSVLTSEQWLTIQEIQKELKRRRWSSERGPLPGGPPGRPPGGPDQPTRGPSL